MDGRPQRWAVSTLRTSHGPAEADDGARSLTLNWHVLFPNALNRHNEPITTLCSLLFAFAPVGFPLDATATDHGLITNASTVNDPVPGMVLPVMAPIACGPNYNGSSSRAPASDPSRCEIAIHLAWPLCCPRARGDIIHRSLPTFVGQRQYPPARLFSRAVSIFSCSSSHRCSFGGRSDGSRVETGFPSNGSCASRISNSLVSSGVRPARTRRRYLSRT
jgi:hypothetical protein